MYETVVVHHQTKEDSTISIFLHYTFHHRLSVRSLLVRRAQNMSRHMITKIPNMRSKRERNACCASSGFIACGPAAGGGTVDAKVCCSNDATQSKVTCWPSPSTPSKD